MGRYFINSHNTSLALERAEDGITVSFWVVAGGGTPGDGILVLIGNVHIAQCAITRSGMDAFPVLALDNTVVPFEDYATAQEVADHLGLTMPVTLAGEVTHAGHA